MATSGLSNAAAGALGVGIAGGVSSALSTTGGTFAAGFWGTAGAGTATSSFFTGAAIGGATGFASGFVSGLGNGLLDGRGFGASLGSGVSTALMGGLTGGLLGGITSGIQAVMDNRRFFDGAKVEDKVLANLQMPEIQQQGNANCVPTSISSVDQSYGGNLTQGDIRSLPGLGGDPNVDQLNSGTAWTKYREITGHAVTEDINGTEQNWGKVLSTMQNGGRVNLVYDVSGGAHSVNMTSIIQRTITKISGTVVNKMLYTVMDPASGTYTRISSDLINGANIFYIFR